MSTATNKEAQVRILAKALSDADFKKKLIENPTSVCREEGMEFEGEMRISDTEAGHNLFYLPPVRPEDINIIDATKQASDLIANDNEMF